MGTVKAVCQAFERGTQKQNIKTANFTTDWGMEGDAHGGDWHRQVSLLSYDKVREFNSLGADVSHGDFGENLVVEGIDFGSLPIGTTLRCGRCVLQITQIGKECHSHCQIYHEMGDCIMPREGVFARVIQNGTITVGDTMKVDPRPLTVAILTLSDKCAKGEREDVSGSLIAQMLAEAGYQIISKSLLPDERLQIEESLTTLCDRDRPDLILTTGGTGFSRRDTTPEATLAIAERQAPGIAEAMRAHSLNITPRAMLSRGVSVIRGNTLIVNLPGSPKAVQESLEYVLPHLKHGIEILRGDARECGGQ